MRGSAVRLLLAVPAGGRGGKRGRVEDPVVVGCGEGEAVGVGRDPVAGREWACGGSRTESGRTIAVGRRWPGVRRAQEAQTQSGSGQPSGPAVPEIRTFTKCSREWLAFRPGSFDGLSVWPPDLTDVGDMVLAPRSGRLGEVGFAEPSRGHQQDP